MAAVFTKEALRGQHRDLRLSQLPAQRLIGGARRIQSGMILDLRTYLTQISL